MQSTESFPVLLYFKEVTILKCISSANYPCTTFKSYFAFEEPLNIKI